MSRASATIEYWKELILNVRTGEEVQKTAEWARVRMLWLQQLPSPRSGVELDTAWSVRQQYAQVSDLYDTFAIEVARYTEQLLLERGCGLPPVPYAAVFFGSGGRKEMTAWSDQDHGVIWQDSEQHLQQQSVVYFTEWGEQFTALLSEISFMPCNGNVLASELSWRGSESQWRARVQNWTDEGGWEQLRSFTMVLDMRATYGDEQIVARWRQGLADVRGPRSSLITNEMIRNLLHRKPSHNSFGQLIRERYGDEAGYFDIKYRLYVPIAQMTRMTAWIYGIYEQALSTEERLQALLLVELDNELHPLIYETLENWPAVMTARWLSGGKYSDGYWEGTGKVKPELLSTELKRTLRAAAHTSSRWLRWLERRISI